MTVVVEAEAGQGQQDLETLPLLRVVRATGDRPALGRDARSGVPELDPNFVPACFVLAASPLLGEWVRGLFNQIDAERRARLSELTRDGRLRWENLRGQFEQVLRLRTLNRFMSRLNSLIDAPKLPPFFMYLELSGLLGELSALQPQIASDLNPLPYDHDRLNVCFADLRAKILRALRGPEPPILLEAPFATSEGVLKAELTDDQLDRPTAYYLGVRTRMPADDRDELARSVRDHDQLKVMPPTEVWEPEYGITLGPESFSLPPKEDTAYFPLCRDLSPEKWKKIVTERAAALWLAPNFKWRDADFCLLMTLPTGDQTEQRLP